MSRIAKTLGVCALAVFGLLGIATHSAADSLNGLDVDKFTECVKQGDEAKGSGETLDESLQIRKDCCAKHGGSWSSYSKTCLPPS